MSAPVPALFAAVLRAEGPSRRRAAHAALDPARPWEEWRPVLAAALATDPAHAGPALEALASAADDAADGLMRGRLLTFEAHAAHRAGRMDSAVTLYERAERVLARADAVGEALAAAVARVDALAASGRVDAALTLAASLARRVSTVPAGPGRRRTAAAIETNRGNALRLRGDADEARRAFASAARTFDTLGDARRAAVTRLNAGVAAVEAGDAGRGRELIAVAERVLTGLGLDDLAIEARVNLAWADVHAGRLGDGIRALDRLAGEHRVAGLSRREGVCRMDLADALRRAGDGASAEREALRAAACFTAAHADAERAEALFIAARCATGHGASAVALAKAAYEAARRSGREALALRAELASPHGRTLARGASSRPVAAGVIARRARALGHRALEADARLVEGTLALAAGRPSAARRAFDAARKLSVGRPWTRLSAEAGLAEVDARREGGLARSLRRLRAIAADYDAIRADLPGSWLRSRFAADRLDPHLVRVDLLLARGRPSDRADAEAVLDALAARRVLLPRSRRRDRATERIRARLEAIYDRIARSEGPTRGGDGAMTATLERRAHAWERAFVARRRHDERRSVGAGTRGSSHRGRTRRDVTSIQIWCRGDAVLGLVRHGDVVAPLCALGTVRGWRAWAAGIRLQGKSYTHLRGATPGAGKMATTLLAAIADQLLPALGVERWSRDVRITADPSLPDLPWECLPSDGQPLALAHDVLRTPLGRGVTSTRRSGRGAVVLGVGAPELVGVDDEVRAVAERLPSSRVCLGASATRAALSSALATASVVHVAGHGWDAAEAPPLSGVRLADGWFCADDIPDVVVADLVVLAACRTGRASGPAALAWGGLVSRLLSQGARRVVWTDEDVDDEAAARLMSDFHATRAGWDDRAAFGRSVVRVGAACGHPGAVLPFRLSGVES